MPPGLAAVAEGRSPCMLLLVVDWTFQLQQKAVLLQKHFQATKLAKAAPKIDNKLTSPFISGVIPLLPPEGVTPSVVAESGCA